MKIDAYFLFFSYFKVYYQFYFINSAAIELFCKFSFKNFQPFFSVSPGIKFKPFSEDIKIVLVLFDFFLR